MNLKGSTAGHGNTTSPDTRFGYEDLSPSVEKFLRGQADRIRRQCANSIIQIGKALIESKRHLSHGVFLRWVESEVGFPARTAQAYMRVAHWASGKSATVAHLPPSALYVLSSNGVPEEFVLDVLKRIETGEKLATATMRQELKAFQQTRSAKLCAAQPIFVDVTSQPSYQKAAPSHAPTSRTPIVELAGLLSRKLAAADFARVCEILSSDMLLSDPDFAKKLAREFRAAADGCLMVA